VERGQATAIRDIHFALQVPYVYDYVTKLCRQQAQVIENHKNVHIAYTGQGEA
jgi:hypothetical protein